MNKAALAMAMGSVLLAGQAYPADEPTAAILESSAHFARVNTDKARRVAQRFNIRSNPTKALFRGSHEIARQPVAMRAAQIANWVHAIA